jgi:hydrogenase expression/formation protein HypC
MCLGVPGQVQQIYEANGARMGKVNFGGIVKDVCLAYLPDIQVGDYTIVHVGFAITKIDEASAHETLRTFAEMGLLDEELNPDARAGKSGPVECAVDPFDIRGRQKPN